MSRAVPVIIYVLLVRKAEAFVLVVTKAQFGKKWIFSFLWTSFEVINNEIILDKKNDINKLLGYKRKQINNTFEVSL